MPRLLRPDGGSVTYHVVGRGSPVLLLNGLGATAKGWGAMLDRLAQGHLCIAVDHRGSGGDTLPPTPFTIDDLADDACAVLDDAGLPRADVLGNSFGGMVAQAVAVRHPARVRGLVLASTSFGLGSIPAHPSFAYHLLAARLRRATRTRHLASLVLGPATLVDHPERLDDVVSGVSGHAVGPVGPAVQLQLRAALRWNGLMRLRRIAAPTLVLHGTHDRLVPAANARLMARLIPHATLYLLPRAGHFFITDAGEEAAEVVAAFVARLDRVLGGPASRPRLRFGLAAGLRP